MPISVIGRINILKMSILPKFLYLFQSVQIPLPSSFSPQLSKNVTRLIWNNKRPRLWLSLLYLPFEHGGLKLPDMKLYYLAVQLHSTVCYFLTMEVPGWIEIERNTLGLSVAQVKVLSICIIYSSQTLN